MKPDYFLNKVQERFKKLPKPAAFKNLQEQAREAKKARKKKAKIFYKDDEGEKSPAEREYQQAENDLYEALVLLQFCILTDVAIEKEMLTFMDYFPPMCQTWFLMHDKDGKIAQMVIDKFEFIAKRVTKGSSGRKRAPRRGKDAEEAA